MEFEDALKELKSGKHITNTNWNGKGMHIAVMHPAEFNNMDLPYIFMQNANGECVPWLASQQDMFSNGWEVTE